VHAPDGGGLRRLITLPLASRRPRMRVLVVEDSRSLADGIAEGLRDQGMAVDAAYDGRQLSAACSSPADADCCRTLKLSVADDTQDCG
jgi:CheY-like chemotaxis protein